jgi:hypothetical protein
MEKIKLTPEQFAVFERGNNIEVEDGTIYFHFPYWIKKISTNGTYELYTRSEIPGLKLSYKNGGLEEHKYEISKTDGSPMDPEAWYFVLRVDKDKHARVAALAYAKSVAKDNIKLCLDLLETVIGYDPLQTKTSEEWQKIFPYKILDPDGWDRTNYDFSWKQELITWEEFKKRAFQSTCIFDPE